LKTKAEFLFPELAESSTEKTEFPFPEITESPTEKQNSSIRLTEFPIE
jgi:hypothetical protein